MSTEVQDPRDTRTLPAAGAARPTPAEPRTPPTPPRPAETPAAAPLAGPAPASASNAPAARRRPRFLSRRVLLPVAAIVVLGAGILGYMKYREGQMYVSTDNAQLTGTPIQVGAMNAGRVDTVNVKVGGAVHKGDVLAQVALPSQVGVAQNGQPRFDFLGSGDTHVDVTAPSDGVVIAVPVTTGATVAAGQPVVTLVNPAALWVNANIEETNVSRVRVGQPVTIHVDALDADIPGRVDAVTPATAASFSILPASNASGNFNKVTQLVPVRIAVNLGNQPTLLGASVEVKIQVAE